MKKIFSKLSLEIQIITLQNLVEKIKLDIAELKKELPNGQSK